MHEWIYKPGEVFPDLTLAADTRRVKTSYIDDQIWELVPGRGEPPSLAVQTTYGLRARSLRIFPRFGKGDVLVHDPAEFPTAITVFQYGPSFLKIHFSPLPELQCELDLWVPCSQAIAGQLRLLNMDKSRFKGRIQLCALLVPVPDGQRMTVYELKNTTVLAGESSNLAPVVFLTGGAHASSGPYTALELPLELAPAEQRTLQWVSAALDTKSNSFHLVRSLLDRPWAPELARLEMLNAGQIDIVTGDQGWDTAFALAQNAAYRLLVSGNDHLPHTSFVMARQPDYGYSQRGNGSDYNHLWNGQTALFAFYLAAYFLPTNPEVARGLLENFLNAQNEDGSIDAKPGLGGQRSGVNAAPLLASMAWRIYKAKPERSFLESVFPRLYAFFESWFSPDNDRDGDGFPEWSHAVQTGQEDHPSFAHWLDGGPGLDITTVETPDLAAFLYAEGKSLGRIAHLLGQKDLHTALQKRILLLQKALDGSFDRLTATYRSRDRDTHYSEKGRSLGKRHGPGEIKIDQRFKIAVRLYIAVQTPDGGQRRTRATIHGVAVPSADNQEMLGPGSFRWRPGAGQATSQFVFLQVDHVVIEGVEETDQIIVTTSDYGFEDISSLIPLWAGIADPRRAQQIVRKAILAEERFGRLFGLPYSSLPPEDGRDAAFHTVHLPWNALVIEGLLAYNLQSEAAQLFTRLMSATVQSLNREGTFRRFYHAESGLGSGERDCLDGLAPVGLFLQVLGVELIDARQVRISGRNPFPWPVTVKFRGLTVLRQADKTTVIFPNGQSTSLTSPAPHLVRQG